jgi:alpha-N-arabinofuranosidase
MGMSDFGIRCANYETEQRYNYGFPMNRRHFLLSTSAALLAPRSSSAATARIEIVPDEAIGTISPDIYGHFIEHLGGCIYDGVWVGEKSKIPNYSGVRKALVDNLKRLKPPVIRWPGGCFADSYNWRDGVGPRERRPRHTNFWANNEYLQKVPSGPQKYDPNEFGTNEFARFCKLSGAEPYLAGNVRSLTAHDFYEWIEYCNSPQGTTSLADLRAQGGSPEPLNVKYWGVGNESWGCGGSFTGDEYAIEFRRWAEWVPEFGNHLSFIASGPNVADYAWTRSFFEKIAERGGPRALRRIFGTALHYYCGTTGKGVANEFTADEWYELLSKATRMEELIHNHWQIMGETDKDHRVKLVVDEWGGWHHTDPSIDPSYLWAYFPTLRDALVSGITLDIFNRHADKVAMANAAQLINNIHTSFVAVGDKFTVTPVFHVFEMYAPHQGATSIRTSFSASRVGPASAHNLPGLTGSCSLQGRRAFLTVVNADAQNAQDTTIDVRNARVTSARARVLTATDTHARNTFEQPDALKPIDDKVTVGSPLTYSFRPASVTCLELQLG